MLERILLIEPFCPKNCTGTHPAVEMSALESQATPADRSEGISADAVALELKAAWGRRNMTVLLLECSHDGAGCVKTALTVQLFVLQHLPQPPEGRSRYCQWLILALSRTGRMLQLQSGTIRLCRLYQCFIARLPRSLHPSATSSTTV